MSRDSVCKDCAKRSTYCHCTCPEYAEDAQRFEASRQARQEHLTSQAFTRGQESRERTRMMQRKKGYGK